MKLLLAVSINISCKKQGYGDLFVLDKLDLFVHNLMHRLLTLELPSAQLKSECTVWCPVTVLASSFLCQFPQGLHDWM